METNGIVLPSPTQNPLHYVTRHNMRQRKTVPKGWLEDIVSDGVKKWVGYFHIRENNERKKKQITLGQCSRLTKTDANKMLEKHIADVIERQNTTIVKDITVEE